MSSTLADVKTHPQAICESKSVGKGTTIWAFAHVLPGAKIGSNCNICDHTFIEGDVIVGNNVTLKSGVQLWDGVRIEDDVFIGPNASFTNDLFPRSKQRPKEFLQTIVRKGASIGANATLLPGIEIGEQAMVGAGTVVTQNVPPYGIVVGNPGRLVGYTNEKPSPGLARDEETHTPTVKGVQLIALPWIKDLRGNLGVIEHTKALPFQPKRTFYIVDVPGLEVRGEHAHKACDQFLVCLKGSVRVTVDDGTHRDHFLLSHPSRGVYIPAGVWGMQDHYSPDAVLMVLASHEYDGSDYIRSYDRYLEYLKKKK